MRSASPGEIEQVHALGVIEVQRTCDRVQDAVRGSGEVTAFQEAIKVMVTP